MQDMKYNREESAYLHTIAHAHTMLEGQIDGQTGRPDERGENEKQRYMYISISPSNMYVYVWLHKS